MAATLTKRTVTAAETAKTKTPIRADIQALRALAVGLVLLNHLWPEHMPGGYIGVDIFFVISGYLITSHLRREADSTGRIDLPRFWARRAKRLLPAAMVVLIATVAATAIWLPITNRQSAFEQVGAAGSYVLNWLLAASSMDYFAQGSVESPVMHYWSLSVEEQFYIFWPLIVVASLWLTRNRPRRVRITVVTAALVGVFLGSLAWGVHSSNTEAAAAYFESTGRAWEFAAGGLLAFLPPAPGRLKNLLIPFAWAGWCALIFAAFSFNGTSGFPGALALVPVLATAALIWIGDNEHSWAPKGLTSLGPVQLLGDISYSVYLWHWPLIVVLPFLIHREIYARDKMVLLCVIMALAYVSNRYLEDPLRLSKSRVFARPRSVLVITWVTMALLNAVVASFFIGISLRADTVSEALRGQAITNDECFGANAFLSGAATCPGSHTLTNPDSVLLSWQNQDSRLANGTSCQQARGAADVVTCSFGAVEGTQSTNVALVGDSHAGMWAPALSALAVQANARVTTYLESSCAVTADPAVRYRYIPAIADGCRLWRSSVIAKVAADPNIDVVVTSSNNRQYVRVTSGNLTPDSGEGYVDAWGQWLAAGKRVVAINDVPQHQSFVNDCISESRTSIDPCTIPADPLETPGPLDRAASVMIDPAFTYVNLEKVFCDTECHSVIGGIPAYIDSDHLSAPFARSFVPGLLNVNMISKR